jgi:tetratricopeptide (TPR) repeat protein/transcriptional regulator with XRE-family HTH domain
MDAMQFGDLVRSVRHRTGLTQEELAEASGVSVRAIVDLERGQVRRPRSGTVRRIADACHLTGPARTQFEVAAREGSWPNRDALSSVVFPAQLPPALVGFSGRTRELSKLDDLVARAVPAPTGPAIAVVSGTAGVGKTALAVYWAHQVVDRFPDGQLYANLRGFEPAGEPRTPDDTVRGFLDALGVPPERIPADLDAKVGLYRSLIAGQRMLILLDNARDAAQVRPLLPGTASAFVVVTSRDSLAGLVAAAGAKPVPVGLLDPDGSRALLAGRLGANLIAAQPGPVQEIVERCAGLPLALAVVAARAAASPDGLLSLSELAAELATVRRGLDPLVGTDAATDVRSVFAGSYRTLSPGAGRLFRLLALYPAGEFGEPVAASLAGHPVRPLLTELTRAFLIMPVGPGRYTWHDLLRSYALELLDEQETGTPGVDGADLAIARRRLLGHLLHTAQAADRLVIPSRDPIPLDPAEPGAVIRPLEDREAALAWFATERRALVAATDMAAEAGLDRYAWQLAWAALEYLNRWGYWADSAAVHETALAAAIRLGDLGARALTHRGLGRAYGLLGRLDDAEAELTRAVELFTTLGSSVGAARTELSLAGLAERRGRYSDALHHATRALELFRQADGPIGVGNALNTVAWYHSLIGDHVTALALGGEALTVLQTTGDRFGLASTWECLGVAHHGLGTYAEAIDCYRRALELHRANADRYGESEALHRLGDAYAAFGATEEAGDARERAAQLDAELGAARR